MKALVKLRKGFDGLEIMEVDRPDIKSDELLVKVMAAGICGTDLHIRHDEYPYTPRVIMGHEYTGIVEDMGSDVSGFSIGDQVISMTSAICCGNCIYCNNGLSFLCNERKSIGSGVNGAMAEYIAIPSRLAFVLPDNMTGSDVMALAEPLACVIRAVIEQSSVKAGDVAVVSGPGTIGQLTVLLAKMQGAFVILSGTPADAERLELGKEIGADIVVDNRIDLLNEVKKHTYDGADVAFECAGSPKSLDASIDSLKKTGIISQIGLFGKRIDVDMDKILMKELKLTVSYATERSSWDILLKLIQQNRLEKVEKLISARFPLSRWREAFGMAENKEGYKILMVP